jgi:hypothetical protein
MNPPTPPKEPRDLPLKPGKATRFLVDYGFVSADDAPDQDLYFKMSWLRGFPPLVKSDAVAFDVRTFGSNRQAHRMTRSELPVSSSQRAFEESLACEAPDLFAVRQRLACARRDYREGRSKKLDVAV